LHVAIRWIFGPVGQAEFTCQGSTVRLPEGGG
jgi:hypothetical protein